MKNSTEYLKGCKVPTVSETMSPNFLDREGEERKKHRTAWGNNDFKSLIRENMKDFEERKDMDIELKVGDTIKCHDKDDMIDTFQALQKEGVDTDFLYEKDGKKGLWLIVLSVEGSENG